MGLCRATSSLIRTCVISISPGDILENGGSSRNTIHPIESGSWDPCPDTWLCVLLGVVVATPVVVLIYKSFPWQLGSISNITCPSRCPAPPVTSSYSLSYLFVVWNDDGLFRLTDPIHQMMMKSVGVCQCVCVF